MSPPDATPPPDRRLGPVRPADRFGAAGVALGLAIVVAVAVALVVRPPQARAAAAQAGSGGELYAQHCASCHQATGLGIEGTFPPLVGNPAAADLQYVEDVIRNGLSGPIEVLGVPYDEVMPPAAALTDPGEIQALVQYVAELSTASAAATGGSAEPGDGDQADGGSTDEASSDGTADGEQASGPVVGDIDRGHDLFLGAARFDNDGAACVGCHTAGSVGNLGGPGLGPDLTGTFDSLGGEAGLTGWLANPPSPTMQPLFADRPLTEAEVADVVAFLEDAPRQQQASSTVDRLTVFGLVGLAVLLAGMAVVWRGMRRTYLDRLQSRRPGSRQRGNRNRPTRAAAHDRSPVAAQR